MPFFMFSVTIRIILEDLLRRVIGEHTIEVEGDPQRIIILVIPTGGTKNSTRRKVILNSFLHIRGIG